MGSNGRQKAVSSPFCHAATPTEQALKNLRALAAKAMPLNRNLSDLVNQAYGLTPAEIELMWQTAPPRMPIPPPAT